MLAEEGICCCAEAACLGNQWGVTGVPEGVFGSDSAGMMLRGRAWNEGQLQAVDEVD